MSQQNDANASDYDSSAGSAGNEDKLKAAQDKINTAFESAREKSAEACEQAEAYIRKSPLEAVGLAAGIGAILGLVVGLFGGRRR